MVLRYYGADSAAVAGADRAYDPVLRGSQITEPAKAASAGGFVARVEQPGEDSLRALLTAGVPPILLYSRGVGPVTRRHYGVIVAWEPQRDRYGVNDGSAATRW